MSEGSITKKDACLDNLVVTKNLSVSNFNIINSRPSPGYILSANSSGKPQWIDPTSVSGGSGVSFSDLSLTLPPESQTATISGHYIYTGDFVQCTGILSIPSISILGTELTILAIGSLPFPVLHTVHGTLSGIYSGTAQFGNDTIPITGNVSGVVTNQMNSSQDEVVFIYKTSYEDINIPHTLNMLINFNFLYKL
jgi:hypothetical protein